MSETVFFSFNMSIRLGVSSLPSLVMTIILLCVSMTTYGFNIDTKNVRIMSGPKGTQFGYTAKFLPQATDDSLSLIVGAPSASTRVGGPNSGVVHICSNVLAQSGNCVQTVFIDDDYVFDNDNATHNEGFGSSVAIANSDTIMVCSPQWKDTSRKTNYLTFMPGRCSWYSMKDSTKIKELRPYYKETDTNYVIPIDGRYQYYKGVGSFGFSADYTQDSVFAFGSPGILISEGSVYVRDENTRESSQVAVDLVTNKLYSTAYGYLGYSVKIGKFCETNEFCLAAGAPNLNRVGNVFLYKWTKTEKFLTILQILPGHGAWSYFGYTLCAGDITGDGYDELLVGAPHHTDIRDTSDGYDQGRVFVYSRTASDSTMELKGILDGNRKKFARFGSAVQSIGDINLDSYLDFAVGAPGEDDGQGCLYVYLGSLMGLITKPSQRIAAAKLSTGLTTPLKGLGYALSDHQVPKNEKYPVFAATSVVSDSIAILKCRPIVDATSTLTADPNPVDIEEPCALQGITKACFMIDFCLQYDIRGESKRRLNFLIGLDIDTEVKSNGLKRALFRLRDGSEVSSIPMTKQLMKANGMCLNYTAVLRENQVNTDRFTPVRIIVRYELDKDMPINFDPVLDALKPRNVTLDVTFVNECGADNTCQVDLKVDASVDYNPKGSWKSVVINETKELIVKVDVKNSNEPSYWTVIRVKVNSSLPFNRLIDSSISDKCKAVEPSAADIPDDSSSPIGALAGIDETIVECNHIRPLGTDESIEVTLAFDTEDIDLTRKSLKVTAEAMPKKPLNNPEIDRSDNTVGRISNIEIIADVSIAGSSSPSEVIIYDPKQISLTSKVDMSEGYITTNAEVIAMNLTHKMLVRNKGPSFLPQTTVQVAVPMFLPDGTQFVHQADVKIAAANGQVTQCSAMVDFQPQRATTAAPTSSYGTTGTPKESSTSGIPTSQQSSSSSGITTDTTTDGNWIPDVGPNRKKREADDNGKVLDKIYTLSCSLDIQYCQIFECNLNDIIDSGSHAEINVSLVLDKANIPIPKAFNSFYFLTQARVTQPDHSLFKPWATPRVHQTLTKFHFLPTSGGKINIWIIIGCVIGGLVLITLIVIILWKVGFFKRDKHHEVERWKRESIRRSRKGGTPTATAEPQPGGDI